MPIVCFYIDVYRVTACLGPKRGFHAPVNLCHLIWFNARLIAVQEKNLHVCIFVGSKVLQLYIICDYSRYHIYTLLFVLKEM